MILITEGFNPGKLPEITQKIVDVLQRRIKRKIGLDPITVYNFKPQTGGNFVGYKAAVNNGKALGFFYDSKFSLSCLAVYKDFMDQEPDGYILLQGYNIIQVLDEITKILDFYFHNGYLPNEMDLEEAYILLHQKLKERGRPSKAKEVFDAWIKDTSNAEYLLQNERLSNVYKTYFDSWADQNNLFLNVTSFYTAAKEYLAKNRMQNKYARKTVVINKAGKTRVIDSTKSSDRVSFEKLKAINGYEDKFEQLKMNLYMIFKDIRFALYTYGTPGSGKSYQMETWAKEFKNQKDYMFISQGVINTTKDFVDILYKYREDYVLIFDDLDDLTKGKNRGILLNIMNSGKKDRQVIFGKHIFEFTSNIVFISNKPLVDTALKSRAVTIPILLDKKEFMAKIMRSLKDLLPVVPLDIKQHVFEYLLEEFDDIKQIDLRLFQTACAQYLAALQSGQSHLAGIWIKRVLNS